MKIHLPEIWHPERTQLFLSISLSQEKSKNIISIFLLVQYLWFEIFNVAWYRLCTLKIWFLAQCQICSLACAVQKKKALTRIDFIFLGNAVTEAGEDSKSLPGVIFAFLVISLLKEIFQIFWQRLGYFKNYTNLVDLSMYLSTLIFILPYLTNQELYGDVRVQWTFGTLALLLCYSNWCLSLRRITSLSLYITMYIEVLQTFVRVILIFAVLLLGYTLVFYVLLKEEVRC